MVRMFWKWIMGMVAHHCECIYCPWIVHLKWLFYVFMVNFVLCIFYHNKKDYMDDYFSGYCIGLLCWRQVGQNTDYIMDSLINPLSPSQPSPLHCFSSCWRKSSQSVWWTSLAPENVYFKSRRNVRVREPQVHYHGPFVACQLGTRNSSTLTWVTSKI